MRHTISSRNQRDLPYTFEPKFSDFSSCCGRGQERTTEVHENWLNWFVAGRAICNPTLQHGQIPTAQPTRRLPPTPTAPSAPEAVHAQLWAQPAKSPEVTVHVQWSFLLAQLRQCPTGEQKWMATPSSCTASSSWGPSMASLTGGLWLGIVLRGLQPWPDIPGSHLSTCTTREADRKPL